MSSINNQNISIIIPIHNEERILENETHKIKNFLQQKNKGAYEIIFIENGSSDKTYQIARKIARTNKHVQVFTVNKPSYGKALKKGMKSSRYNILVQFDIDLIDLEFLKKALIEIGQNDIVVGSKLHKNSIDNRPLPRILLSKMINFLIRTLLHYRGTDTHGIKVYRKTKVFPLIKMVKESNHFFDTEILLQAQKVGLRIAELPINCAEMRQTRFPTTLRISQAFKEFWYLIKKYA